jgi:streptogramin lyase
MIWSKKVLLCSFVLVLLSVSVGVTFASVHASRAAGTPTVTDYHIPSGLDPWGTAFDSSGNVWVAVPGCNPNPDCGSRTAPGKIEVFNPTTSTWISTYQLPTGYGQALFLAFDSNGNLWFPMFHTNMLGEMVMANKSFQEWSMPTAASGPWDLAFDHNGKLWITEHFGNKVAEFDPSTNTFLQELATPSASSNPYGITVDGSNNVWFTENNSADTYIDEYTNTGVSQRFMIETGSVSNLTPHLITTDPVTGNVWWTEGFVGRLGELNITQAVPGTNAGVSEYTYPRINGTSTHASGISIDKNGLVWFDDALQNSFGSFPDTGTGTFSMYVAPSSRSHPHDGLQVDSLNRVWFDEQYAEKLAVAVQA